MAPHGIFRARGEDRWISIAIRDDREWRTLARFIDAALLDDERFATLEARKLHEDELEAIISAWTQERHEWQLMEALQAAGLAVVPVMDMRDVAEDPHMNERGFFVELEHPEAGVQKHAGIPWKLHGTPVSIDEPAPCMGEDNEYVVRTLLGRSKEDYECLLADGVLY